MIENKIPIFAMFNAADEFKNEFNETDFFKNFILGNEISNCGACFENAIKSYKKFFTKNNNDSNAFSFYYQITIGFERLLKSLLLMTSNDGKSENVKKYGHNLKKILDEIEKRNIISLDQKSKNLILSFCGKYDMRYENFENKDFLEMRSGYYKYDLLQGAKTQYCNNLEFGNLFMGKINSKEVDSKFVFRQVGKFEKDLMKITEEIAERIRNESYKLNIFTYESLNSKFFTRKK